MCKKFDLMIMKPIFIRKYQHMEARKKDEFYENFIKEGDYWENIYLNDKGEGEGKRMLDQLSHIYSRRGTMIKSELEKRPGTRTQLATMNAPNRTQSSAMHNSNGNMLEIKEVDPNMEMSKKI